MMDDGSDSFVDIYTAVAAAVAREARERGVRPPYLRDPSVADVSVLAVPRATLLDIEDDEVFVASCYLLLLDRSPTDKEVDRRVSRLRQGAIDRDRVIDSIVDSLPFARSGRRVRFT